MNKIKSISVGILAFLLAILISCGNDDSGATDDQSSSSVSSSSGVGDVKTVKIGNQYWMKKNSDVMHNTGKGNSWCYDNVPANCEKYGRLYDWAAAMNLPSSCNSSSCANQIQTKHRGICPDGFHIPTDAEWGVLFDFAGGESEAGHELKTEDGWDEGVSYKAGIDAHGFSALPGGRYTGQYDGKDIFSSAGQSGYWWRSSEDGFFPDSYANNFGMISTSDGIDAIGAGGEKSYGYSVRCLRD